MKTTFRNTLAAGLVTALAGLPLAGCGGGAQTKEDAKPTQASVDQQQDSVAALVADAGKLMRDGKPAEAKAKYEAVLKKEPGNKDARLGLAAAHLKLRELDQAGSLLDALQKEAPEEREVILLVGLLHKEKGDYDSGIQLYKAALQKRAESGGGHDQDILNNLVVLYRLKGDYDEGVEACKKLLSRDPDNVDALKNLSLIYFDQGKFQLSETIAINSLKLNDKDAALYNNRGMIRVKRGRYPEAVAFFKKAVEIDPGLISAHLNLGSIALRYRDYDTASRHFGEAMKIEPRHPEANLGYGLALSGQQKADQAIAQLQRALEIAPGSKEAIGEMAMIQKFQLNKLPEAQQWCGKYREAAGGKDDKDPILAECTNIDNEIKNAEMAKKAMEQMKAAEEAEKAQQGGQPGDG